MTRRTMHERTGEVVLRRLSDGVAVISLNRPERHNAINDALARQLVDGVWGDTIRRGMRQELLAQATLFADRRRGPRPEPVDG